MTPTLVTEPIEPAGPSSRRRPAGQIRTDADLLRRYKRLGDRDARDELVARMLPLVRSVVHRYAHGDAREDLMQVGTIGLLLAIERFDADRGVELSSFAVPTIVGEVRRYFRDRTWAVRPPRDLQERVIRVRRAAAELTAGDGGSPTPRRVAEALDMPVEDVVEALVAGDARSASSLDAPATGQDGEARALGDTLPSMPAHDAFAAAESRATLAQLRGALTPREQEVLRLRFEEDLTQAEIGSRVGVSQMQVSRILRGALRTMRHAADTAHGARAGG